MNKKLLFFIIVSFFIGILIALLIGSRPLSPKIIPPSPQISPPLIRETITSSSPIMSRLSKEAIRIPASLPFYQFAKQPLDKKQADDIAVRLGFPDAPAEFTGTINGESWVWSAPAVGTLRIVPRLHFISYHASNYEVTPGIFVEDEKLIEVAASFLATHGLVARDQARFSAISFLADAGHDRLSLAPKEKADFADVHFREALGGYPIVNSTIGIGTISVRINRASRIIAAFVDLSGKITKSGDIPLKQYHELISSLSEAKIQGLDCGTIEPAYQADIVVDSVIVTAGSLAYLQEGNINQQFLQPIFVLTGDGLLSDGRTVAVTLYLPAPAQSSFSP